MTTHTTTAAVSAPSLSSARVAHIRDQDRKALCGAPITKPVAPGAGRCVVCLEMVSYGRFSTR